MTQEQKIRLFHKWLVEKRDLFKEENDEDSAYLFESIITMFEDVFRIDEK